jgi:hypothetical protein
MTPRAAIQQLGRRIRNSLRSGELSAGAYDVGDMLVEQPDAVLLIVDVTGAEARKRRPDERLCQAYAFMLGQTLERLRQRAEAGQGIGAVVIDQVRTTIARQLAEGKLLPPAAMLLAAAFTRNGMELGDVLRDALDVAMVQGGDERGGEAPPDPASMLKSLAEACDHDPFMIHTELAAMIAATPPEVQLTLLDALVEADVPDLREAATGWLLAEPALALPLARRIEVAAKQGLVSTSSVAHLMIMRNWVPDNRKPGIDAIIKAARVHSATPSRGSSIQVRELLISERDGAGAQSVFASVKEGRDHALVSILVKQGHGVRDAWVAQSLGKAEVEGMLARITTEMPHHDATAEDVSLLVNAALADGAAAGAMPPFGLIQAVRLITLADVTPTTLAVTDLLSTVLADAATALVSEREKSQALRTSGQWLAYSSNVQSWFENGDEVLAARKGKRKKEDRIAAIVQEVLEPHRAFWAEVIAWSAFARRGSGAETKWVDMALVAREFASDRPLVDLPLATLIAVQTDAAASA